MGPHLSQSKLRPYQIEGALWLAKNPFALLADEMGLGKTIQVIAWANMVRPKNILIICPASLKINWCNEWAAHTTLNGLIGYVRGSKWPEGVSIVVINYDLLARHRVRLREELWDAIILDEAHYIKNATAQRTKEILGSKRMKIKAIPACQRIALTGTPMLNRPIEMYPLLRWLRSPNIGKNELEYAMKYCGAHLVDMGYGKQWDFRGASNLDGLRDEVLAPLMLRRDKVSVLQDLPDKVKQVIAVDVKRTKHDESIKKEIDALDAMTAVSPDEIINSLQSLVPDMTEMSTARLEEGLAKLPAVIEHLEDAISDGRKVVCFCHHREVALALQTHFAYKAVHVIGGMTAESKNDAVSCFQTSESKQLFIGNIQAAGVGITLTASSHVVFAELSWVPGEMLQAEDRCHRFGQKNSVLVQYLVVNNSLEAAMAKALVRKSKILSKVLDKRAY